MRYNMLISIMFILFTGLYPTNLFADSQDIIIIGNKNAADSVTKGEIKEIFLGHKTRWENNESLSFVLFRDEKLYEAFLKEYIGKTVSQFSSYWKMQVFNGTGRMPIFFRDKAEVMEFVSETQGAVGFVSSGNISTDKVKILNVK